MAYNPTRPFYDKVVTGFNPVGGTPTGSRMSIPMPYRGFVTEVGCIPNSLVTSAMTMAVAVNASKTSSAASNFSQFVTSTLGTFSSTNTYEGAPCSVQGLYQSVTDGDALQFTTSGGQTSAVGCTVYAVVRSA